jgi:RNA-directed DNA polymerase
VNTDELEHAVHEAELRVLKIQAKLHRWARDDPHRRFGDLFNLVADPGFLLVAWDRVRGNKGARTAGVDGHTAPSIALEAGAGEFLGALRSQLKDRSFRPLPVRERLIPKPGGKLRRLGIATVISYCPSCRHVSGCFRLAKPVLAGPVRGFACCEHGR